MDSSNAEQIALNDQIAYVLERDNSASFMHELKTLSSQCYFRPT